MSADAPREGRVVPAADTMPEEVQQEVNMLREENPETNLDEALEETRKAIYEEVRAKYTAEQKAEAWQQTINAVRGHSRDLVGGWNTTIDTLLTFSGLFSAVLTAFNVQTYTQLQPDDTVEAIRTVSAQLAALSTGSSISTPATPSVSPSIVAINALWFASLIFSLSAALTGIVVKQWLHAYRSGLSGDTLEIALLRQYRLENLEKWRVPAIVATLPILLQISVILFLAGLLILLWTLNVPVAALSTVLISALLAFLAFTTIMPSVAPGCSYHSPQSELVMAVMPTLRYCIAVTIRTLLLFWFALKRRIQEWKKPSPRRSLGYWYRSYRDLSLRLVWRWPHWREQEQGYVAEASDALRANLALKAYSITLDDGFLDTALNKCLADLDPPQALRLYRAVTAIPSARSVRRKWRSWANPRYTTFRYHAWELALSSRPSPYPRERLWDVTAVQDDVWHYESHDWKLSQGAPVLQSVDADALIRVLAFTTLVLRPDPAIYHLDKLNAALSAAYAARQPVQINTLRYILVACKTVALRPQHYDIPPEKMLYVACVSAYCMGLLQAETGDPKETQHLLEHGFTVLRLFVLSGSCDSLPQHSRIPNTTVLKLCRSIALPLITVAREDASLRVLTELVTALGRLVDDIEADWPMCEKDDLTGARSNLSDLRIAAGSMTEAASPAPAQEIRPPCNAPDHLERAAFVSEHPGVSHVLDSGEARQERMNDSGQFPDTAYAPEQIALSKADTGPTAQEHPNSSCQPMGMDDR